MIEVMTDENSTNKEMNFTADKMEKIDSENVKISVDRSGVPAIVENLVHGGVKVYGVYSEEVSLEDAFLKKTGGNVIE